MSIQEQHFTARDFFEAVGESFGEIGGLEDPLLNGGNSSKNYLVLAIIFPFELGLEKPDPRRALQG